MAVRIRLKRLGAKKQPHYRFVVADARSPRDGRFIAELGYYNPTSDPVVIKVDEEKTMHWLARGAQPSDTVRALFKQAGVMEKFRNLKTGKTETTEQAGN